MDVSVIILWHREFRPEQLDDTVDTIPSSEQSLDQFLGRFDILPLPKGFQELLASHPHGQESLDDFHERHLDGEAHHRDFTCAASEALDEEVVDSCEGMASGQGTPEDLIVGAIRILHGLEDRVGTGLSHELAVGVILEQERRDDLLEGDEKRENLEDSRKGLTLIELLLDVITQRVHFGFCLALTCHGGTSFMWLMLFRHSLLIFNIFVKSDET